MHRHKKQASYDRFTWSSFLIVVSPWRIGTDALDAATSITSLLMDIFRNESSTVKWIVNSNAIRIHYVG